MLVSFFFGLFGLIPAIRHSRMARERGYPDGGYWVAFGCSFGACMLLAVALPVLLVVAAAHSGVAHIETTPVLGVPAQTVPAESNPGGGYPPATDTPAPSYTPPTAAPGIGVTRFNGPTPCPSFSGTNPRAINFSSPPPNCLAAGKAYTATISTNMGNVAVAFDTTKTPATTNNFVVLALYHYFDGTALFRTDTSIGIIQGGSPHTQSASDPGPGYSIADEGSGYTYAPGDLVMARTSAPNSGNAQFFFCVTDACSQLNSQGTYVVFAHVISGLNVLQQILNSNVDNNSGLGGAPAQPVTISSVDVRAS